MMVQKQKLLHLLFLAAAIALLACNSCDSAGKITNPKERGSNLHSYTDLGNGIIKDTVTGLMWQKATAPGTYAWEQALTYCSSLALGGYTHGWRLPTDAELLTLVDFSQFNPAINTSYFPDTVARSYWSSSTYTRDSDTAWLVNFYFGFLSCHYRTYLGYVRAVRAEQ